MLLATFKGRTNFPQHLEQLASARINKCYWAGLGDPSAVGLERNPRTDSLDPFNLFFDLGLSMETFP